MAVALPHSPPQRPLVGILVLLTYLYIQQKNPAKATRQAATPIPILVDAEVVLARVVDAGFVKVCWSMVGAPVGAFVGVVVGALVGIFVGASVSVVVGKAVGELLGAFVGGGDGLADGGMTSLAPRSPSTRGAARVDAGMSADVPC